MKKPICFEIEVLSFPRIIRLAVALRVHRIIWLARRIPISIWRLKGRRWRMVWLADLAERVK